MKHITFLFTRHIVSLFGAIVTTVSAVFILTLFAFDAFGYHGGPYIGLVAFVVLPTVFIGGLLMIPVGHWLEHRREKKLLAQGKILDHRLPIIDLNRERTRLIILIVVALTGINIAIIAATTYKSVEIMESTAFCGKTCHTVMEPEFTTYQRSPHSRVKCVECHIGSGASWFVKSKLSGSWQLISVAFGLYKRPIETPVHNLRPARETCEQCHWPTKFVGDKLKVHTHFDEDEQSTEKKTVMMVRIGGSQTVGSNGIHWHVDPKNSVRYMADEKRETIGDVELVKADGTKMLFKSSGAAMPQDTEWRTMDCVDCHNRPTHVYHSAIEEVESAMVSGRIDRKLPFIRREAVKAIDQDYPDLDTARAQILKSLTDFYAKQLPKATPDQTKAIAAAASELADLFSYNVFPKMNIKWGTYKSNLGHNATVGCFRCHDGDHKAADGTVISQDCSTCHKILAMDEKDPAIMKQLGTPNLPARAGN